MYVCRAKRSHSISDPIITAYFHRVQIIECLTTFVRETCALGSGDPSPLL
jgi:hypothetical protein